MLENQDFNSSDQTDDGEPMIGRRSAARLRLAIPVKLVSLFGELRCILIDVSRSGAQVSLETPLAVDECAVMNIAGVEMFGCVNRSDPGRYGGTNGIEFDPPISDEDVLKLRAHSEAYEDAEKLAFRKEVQHWVQGR